MAETSNSMLRKPTNLQDYARGAVGQIAPFAPGGISLVNQSDMMLHDGKSAASISISTNNVGSLLLDTGAPRRVEHSPFILFKVWYILKKIKGEDEAMIDKSTYWFWCDSESITDFFRFPMEVMNRQFIHDLNLDRIEIDSSYPPIPKRLDLESLDARLEDFHILAFSSAIEFETT
jgi:hypothetical protein